MIRQDSSWLGYDLDSLDLGRVGFLSPAHSLTPGWDPSNSKAQTRDIWHLIDDRIQRHVANPIRVKCAICSAPPWFTCAFNITPRVYPERWFPVHVGRIESARSRYYTPFLNQIKAESEGHGNIVRSKIMRDRWVIEGRYWRQTEVYRCPLCFADDGEPCYWLNGEECPPGSIHGARYEQGRKMPLV